VIEPSRVEVMRSWVDEEKDVLLLDVPELLGDGEPAETDALPRGHAAQVGPRIPDETRALPCVLPTG
jgi:hypothetical protein